MPRPPKCRRVESEPRCTLFKPAGIPKHRLEQLVLTVEELEAIRLKDCEGLEQAQCAVEMNVSRATFQRILSLARKKLAEAIVKGKAIRIEGGYYQINNRNFRCRCCLAELHLSCANGPGQGKACPECGKILE